jgi:hypothetical protein
MGHTTAAANSKQPRYCNEQPCLIFRSGDIRLIFLDAAGQPFDCYDVVQQPFRLRQHIIDRPAIPRQFEDRPHAPGGLCVSQGNVR